MTGRPRKIILLLLAMALLFGVSRVQVSLNLDREALGLTRTEPLENAPPVLAFTTVALGGFRGLISNLLWIRANDLQQNGKYFEMAQLADWITKLEPHFAQVWAYQAWNMAWNISVKFNDYPDRWRWVQRGIELLRDDGLRYNPNSILLHRELAWIFQNKMGANLDDASFYYKEQWAREMQDVLGKKPDFDELIHPKSPEEKRRAEELKNRFKLDPAFMKQVNERYGPLEWRLPEAHAIYWAAQGLKQADEHPDKVKQSDMIMLHRVVYQSMLTAFQRGSLDIGPDGKLFDIGPNLDIIPRVNEVYENAMKEDPSSAENIKTAHRNFLRDAVYFLYVHGRMAEAAKWYQYLGKNYPDKYLIEGNTNSLPSQLSLDEYAVATVQEDINETSRDRVRSAVGGLLMSGYRAMVLGQDDRANTLVRLSQKVYSNYEGKVVKDREEATRLPPYKQIRQEVLDRMLNPDTGLPPDLQAILRTKLGLPPPKESAAPGTSSKPAAPPPA